MVTGEGLVVKNPPANAGDVRDAGLIPGLRRSPGGGSWAFVPLEPALCRGAGVKGRVSDPRGADRMVLQPDFL